MTEAQALEVLSARWKASWDALQPAVPYAFGNEGFSPAGVASFATVLLSGVITTKQLTQGPIGTRRFERKGALAVTLHGSIDAGDAPLGVLVTDAKTTLESQPIGALPDLLYTGACATAAARKGAWYTRTVTIPFTFYETR